MPHSGGNELFMTTDARHEVSKWHQPPAVLDRVRRPGIFWVRENSPAAARCSNRVICSREI